MKMRARSGSQPSLIQGLLKALTRLLANAVESLDHAFASTRTYVAAVSMLGLLQAALITTHVPWLDEVQGLLIAIQPKSFAEVLAQLHYEGHPALWYALLRIIHLVIPADWVLRCASFLTAGIIWTAVLSADRLTRSEKILLLASTLLLFEYSAISRSLGLGAAAFLLALRWWRQPLFWLPVAVLPQCDFLFGVLSGGLVLVRLRDNFLAGEKIPVAGIILWCISGLLAAYAVWPAPDLVSDPPFRASVQLQIILSQLGNLAAPIQIGFEGLQWNHTLFPGILALPATIGLVLILPGKRIGDRAIAVALVAVFVAFSIFVYPLYFRHVSLLALWLIGAYWIDDSPVQRRDRVWRAWLMSMAVCGCVVAAQNLLTPFDAARTFARSIREAGLARATLVSFPDWHAIAVSNELQRPVAGLERQCLSTFVRWNTPQMRPLSYSRFKQEIAEMKGRTGGFYLITSRDLTIAPDVARPVLETASGYSGISYRLWKVGDGGSGTTPLKPCIGAQAFHQGRWASTPPLSLGKQ